MASSGQISVSTSKGLYILFFLLILIGLIPVLIVTYPPTTDLPAHILGAVLHTQTTEKDQTSYLSAEWITSPYILFFLLMYPLIKLFGYLIAAKLILCLYLILFPVAALIFLKTFNPRHWYLAFASHIFIYNYYFEFGFIAFCLGIPLVFITLSATKNAIESPKPVLPIIACCILMTLVYFSHLINLISCSVGIAFLAYFNKIAIDDRRLGDQSFFPPLLRIGVIFIPVAILFVSYIMSLLNHLTDFHTPRKLFQYWSFEHQIQSIIRPFLSTNYVVDITIMTAIGGAFITLFIIRRATIKRGFPLYFAIAMVVLGIVLPRGAFLGGNDLNSRFILIGAIAFLAAIQSSQIMISKFAIVFTIAFLCIISVRIFLYHDVDRQTSAFVRAVTQFIPPNQKIYTVYNAFPGVSACPMLHSISYYHIKKGGYSPFIFADQRHVAGIKSSIHPPISIENWEWSHEDTINFGEALKSYDYLVVTTVHSQLPLYFERYADKIVLRDSVCSIFKLKEYDCNEDMK